MIGRCEIKTNKHGKNVNIQQHGLVSDLASYPNEPHFNEINMTVHSGSFLNASRLFSRKWLDMDPSSEKWQQHEYYTNQMILAIQDTYTDNIWNLIDVMDLPSNPTWK